MPRDLKEVSSSGSDRADVRYLLEMIGLDYTLSDTSHKSPLHSIIPLICPCSRALHPSQLDSTARLFRLSACRTTKTVWSRSDYGAGKPCLPQNTRQGSHFRLTQCFQPAAAGATWASRRCHWVVGRDHAAFGLVVDIQYRHLPLVPESQYKRPDFWRITGVAYNVGPSDRFHSSFTPWAEYCALQRYSFDGRLSSSGRDGAEEELSVA